jgi:uncharacterized membrane protein (DUF485 family)
MEWVLFAVAVICIAFVIGRMYSRRSSAGIDHADAARTDQLGNGGPDSGGGTTRSF